MKTFTCPECGDTDAHWVGIRHEIAAVYHCDACDNTWEEQ